MAVPWWPCFILSLGFIYCYENLSRRKTTVLSQSSTYTDRYASYANDGDLQTHIEFCAHTAPGHHLAWFQVDLGQEYSIKSVKIYYRREGNGPDYWKQYRFKQFYLDVSKSSAAETTTSERTRCYTDTSPDLPDNIFDIPCKQTARYVIVETTYDTPKDDPTTGAILEICEIQVNGCEIGKYGDSCLDCSGCQTCDIISGICTSLPCSVNCVSGLCDPTTGDCTQGCNNGYWRNTCTSICSQNCQGGGCDKTSGNCNGCSNTYWGQTCNTPCPQNCNGGTCDQTNGYCSNGCTQGRHGNKCEQTCNQNCLGKICIQNSGVCTNGCADYYYGDKCENVCSTHCSPRRCDRYNGTCSGCSSGYFGPFCRDTCSVNCAEGTCDQQTGKCDRGCKPNWTGDQCDKCSSDYYGQLCDQRCSSHCVNGICFSNNGTCVRGCTGTFSNDKCTQENVQSCTTECDNSMVIVSIVVSVVIVLTGSVVNFLLWKRNQSQNVKRGLKENTNSPIMVREIPDIPSSENNVRSPYAELGDLDKPNAYEDLHQYTEAV